MLGEAPPSGPVDPTDFEAWFAMGDDGGNRNREIEPYPVGHFIVKAVQEDEVHELEERWLLGHPLNQGEVDLLARAGVDLRDEY